MEATIALFFNPRFRALDANGNPLSGATLTFYIANTTTPASIYRDAALVTPASNPTTGTDTSDASGWFRQFFADEATICDVILKDSSGVTIQTFEDVPFVGATLNTREKLTANRTYYVATTGSDVANDGLTIGSPFLTPQKALDTAAALDFNGFTVTVKIADGTYTGQLLIPQTIGQTAAANLLIQGNTSTPANVVLTRTVANDAVILGNVGTRARITGVKIVADSGSYGIASRGYLEYTTVDFGAALFQCVTQRSGVLIAVGSYTISAGAAGHIQASSNALAFIQSVTITLTGTPAWSTGFASAIEGGVIRAQGLTFSGSATGPRYDVQLNGVIYTVGGGASYFPGNAVGTSATGGQYG